MDACVLIDFCKSDRSVIALVSRHVGEVHVATPVLAEVDQIEESEAPSLGLKLVEPSLEMAVQAATTRGPISFADRLCVLLAKERSWTCVSNDRRLRRACEDEGVSLLWGLELIALLVERNALPAKSAKAIGLAIFATNKFIGKAVLARFLRRVARSGSVT
jgi:hypothetical protein